MPSAVHRLNWLFESSSKQPSKMFACPPFGRTRATKSQLSHCCYSRSQTTTDRRHRVREAIAAGVLHFIHIPGAINPADILSKHWGYTQVKTMLKAILFWEGDTGDIEE